MSPPWVTFRKGCWGDELSFAASSLCTPHSPSLRSHLRCPFLGCWSQTVLGSATQRSDHRWGTPHLRTSLFTQHHLPEASIRTWEDAHRIEWLAAAGGAEQSFCVRGLTSITESLCLNLTCRLTPASKLWLSFGSCDPVPLGMRFHTQTSLTSLSSSPVSYQKWHSSSWPVATSPGSKPSQRHHIFALLPSSFPSLHWISWHKLPSVHAWRPGDTNQYHAPYVLCPLVMWLHTAKCLLHVCFAMLRKQSDVTKINKK